MINIFNRFHVFHYTFHGIVDECIINMITHINTFGIEILHSFMFMHQHIHGTEFSLIRQIRVLEYVPQLIIDSLEG
jgi:hypothetical protein